MVSIQEEQHLMCLFISHNSCPAFFLFSIVKSFFGLGGSGLKIDIVLNTDQKKNEAADAATTTSVATPTGVAAESSSSPPMIVPMNHHPSWRLRKNPFWRVTTAAGGTPVAPLVSSPDGMSTMAHSHSKLYAYESSQNVSGTVVLSLPPGKKAEHLGIKIQFIGRIEMVRYA
jgi:hypothetical protein